MTNNNPPKILFLDQSGKLGGAELSLLDVAKPYRETCLVGLFAEGPFKDRLEQEEIPVRVLTAEAIAIRKDSRLTDSFRTLGSLVPLIVQVAKIARQFDLIYTNTQKAFVVGAVATWLCRRPLVYHLRDILSSDHFSTANRRLAVTLANTCASVVIANSHATRAAFIEAGGRAQLVQTAYNGFDPEQYRVQKLNIQRLRQQLGVEGKFLVGHFSRLSPWKGQHILLEAMTRCPADVTAIFVGDALFGEQDYVEELYATVAKLKLRDRVRFLGFRSDIVPLMAICDLVVHTSTAPEPFGRVIVEAMLSGKPVIAAAAGGAMELVEPGETGWLVAPGDVEELAIAIARIRQHPQLAARVAQQGQTTAIERFDLSAVNRKIAQLLQAIG
ncbi:MAG: glycosyltransferase family 4 protein [Cyanobacteriota bacterium]|nr:glycosyltransferase family 4 protein [Cyanobacteriota bacterium]